MPKGPFSYLSLGQEAHTSVTGVLGWTTNELTDASERKEYSPDMQDLHEWMFKGTEDPILILRRIADDVEQVRIRMEKLGYTRNGHAAEGYEWFDKQVEFKEISSEVQRVLEAFKDHVNGVWTRGYDPRKT